MSKLTDFPPSTHATDHDAAAMLGEAIGDAEGAFFGGGYVNLTPPQVAAVLRWAAEHPDAARDKARLIVTPPETP